MIHLRCGFCVGCHALVDAAVTEVIHHSYFFRSVFSQLLHWQSPGEDGTIRHAPFRYLLWWQHCIVLDILLHCIPHRICHCRLLQALNHTGIDLLPELPQLRCGHTCWPDLWLTLHRQIRQVADMSGKRPTCQATPPHVRQPPTCQASPRDVEVAPDLRGRPRPPRSSPMSGDLGLPQRPMGGPGGSRIRRSSRHPGGRMKDARSIRASVIRSYLASYIEFQSCTLPTRARCFQFVSVQLPLSGHLRSIPFILVTFRTGRNVTKCHQNGRNRIQMFRKWQLN